MNIDYGRSVVASICALKLTVRCLGATSRTTALGFGSPTMRINGFLIPLCAGLRDLVSAP